MSLARIIWLPATGDEAALADAAPMIATIDAQGRLLSDTPPPAWVTPETDDTTVPLVALAPVADAPVRWLSLPDLTPPQAAAAARVAVAQASLGPADALHIVAGIAAAGQAVPVATVTHDAMRGWTGWLAAHGLDPVAIIPLGALVPPPGEGEVFRVELDGAALLRTPDMAFAASGAADDWIIGDRRVVAVPDAERDAALALGIASLPLDLLAGPWRRRAGWGWGADTVRLVRRMALALLLLSLAIPLIWAARTHMATQRADAATLERARAIGITAPDAAAAEAAIDARLAQAGGGPLAFTVPAAALYAAMRDAPAVMVRSVGHRADGTLTVTLAAPAVDSINAVLTAVQARGYKVTAQGGASADGMQTAQITLRAVP